MPRRFIDSKIWEDDEFLELSLEFKLLQIFLISECSDIGIFEQSLRLASFKLGFKVTEDMLFKTGLKVEKLSEGRYWLVNFCKVQYNDLQANPKNKPHTAYIKRLKKEGLADRVSIVYPKTTDSESIDYDKTMDSVSIDYKKTINSLKDKDKEKEQDKEKDMGEGDSQQKPKPPSSLYEVLNYCYLDKGWLDFDAFDFYERNEENHWYKKDGSPVLSWKMWLKSWVNGKYPKKLTAALHKQQLKIWILSIEDYDTRGRMIQGIYDKLQ